MKKQIFLLLILIFSVAAAAFAQSKTVTNADLEKFRQSRLEAEKDYRENYAKLGFPSPQELEKQIAEDKRAMETLAARLQAERLERERAAATEAQSNLFDAQNTYLQSRNNARVERNYYFGYAPFSYFPYGYYIPTYRSNYDRRRRVGRGYRMPPIRPPKPIRPPRLFGSSPNFPFRKR